MKLFDPAAFDNLLEVISISSSEIEKQIENYDLIFNQKRDNEVEWGMSIPMFLYSFYEYLQLNNRIITQNDFWYYFVEQNKVFFDSNNFDDNTLQAIKARLFRTYPSLVRDIHFSCYLKEKSEEAKIIYNQDLDVIEGIDILIDFKENYWAINLYTETKRAFKGREKKASRHTNFDNIIYVELPVKFNGSKECGKFFLYSEKEFLELKKLIYSKIPKV